MMTLPNEQRQLDLEKLRAYIRGLTNGTTVSWLEMETATGIKCSHPRDPGRALFRTAAKRSDRPYKAIIGSGVRMSCKDNAEDIVAGKDDRIKSAIGIACDTLKKVADRHLPELPRDAQARMTHKRALFATLAEMAHRSFKKLTR